MIDEKEKILPQYGKLEQDAEILTYENDTVTSTFNNTTTTAKLQVFSDHLPDMARYYADAMNLPVFPCCVEGKKPAVSTGFKAATTDAEQISAWWSEAPYYNIGLATGHGIVVLDVDVDHEAGKFGDETLAELEKTYGPLPDTWTVLTGNGGQHYYFQSDDSTLTAAVGFAPGLDYRAGGGYVIAPPSVHPNGRTYEWEVNHSPATCSLAPLPDWLYRLMAKKDFKAKNKPVKKGERNDTLFREASSLRAKGMTEDEIFSEISEINEKRCSPPLDESEVRRICKSAAGYERGKKKKPPLTIDNLTVWLAENGTDIRQNAITHEIAITGSLCRTYDMETLESNLHVIIYDAVKADYSCAVGLVADNLNVIASRRKFNPVLDMLAAAPAWDGLDRVQVIYSILNIAEEDTLSRTLIHKWLWQCLAMAKNEYERAYGADGLLVLQGGQGIGKTRFARKIGITDELVKEGGYIDFHDKDTMRRYTSCWICELGEVETTLRSDIERLKSFITASVDEYRLPYGRKDTKVARRTSMIATCNSDRFLIDPTGARRFWTVPVRDINLDELETLDVLQLWKQIETELADDIQKFRLTRAEQARLAERNTAHEKPLKSQEEIEDILSDAERRPDAYTWVSMTVSDFKDEHYSLQRYDIRQIGQALSKLGIEKERQTTSTNQRERMRKLPRLKTSEGSVPPIF